MGAPGRPFIGRLDAVDALRRRTDAAVDGEGGLTLLDGESGVGKSLLLETVLEGARARGLHVLAGRAPALENPPPFLLLRRALESASAVAAPSDASASSSLAFAAQGAGSTDALLGFAPGADRGDAREFWPVEERLLEQLVDPGGGPPAHRGGMSAQIADRLLAVSDRGPTLLALDDLHAADEPSLEVLQNLGPELRRHRLWVLATSLPLERLPERRRGLLEAVLRAAAAGQLHLRPLTSAEVGEFVRTLRPSEAVREEELTWWHSQTGGNPQFLEQLVRSRGLSRIAPAPAAAGAPAAPPVEPIHLLRQQVGRLREEERRVLSVAAVLGREFPFALLERATGEDEERLSEVVQSLVHQGILRETPAEEVAFLREELRAYLDSTLTETHRRLLHRRAAEGLEAMGRQDEPTVYALARHFYLAKIDDKAARYNRLAGELAARTLAAPTARLHFERALESQRRLPGGDPAAELGLVLDLAVQLDRLGELVAADRLLRAAEADLASRPGVPAEQRALLTVYLARIVVNEGQWEEAERLTEPLLAPDAPALPALTRIALHRLRGELFYFLGRYEESLAHHDRALEIARAERNEREIAREMVRRANVLGMTPGRLDEAIEAYHIASRALIAQGDTGEASNALLYLGVVLAQHGRLAESLLQLQAAARLAEEAHEPRRLGWALFNVADVERETGELARAREANRQAREILVRVGDRFGVLQTHIVEGKLLLALNDLAGADVELLEAFRLVRELRSPVDELEVVLRRAELSDRQGDADGARRRVAEIPRARVARQRPDLLPDLDRLLGRLGRAGEEGHAAP
jgi:tetratricopeptide (TPR) repeat protein